MPAGRAGLDVLDRALGERRAGRDGVRADALRAELERQALGQAPERVLRGRVVRHPLRGGMERVDRRDVDDRAAVALLEHLPRGLARAPEGSVHVDVEDIREGVERHLVDADVRVRGGVVDEHVETAEALDGRRHQSVDLVAHRHVADRPRRPFAVLREPPGGRLDAVGAAVGEQHRGAGLGQAPCAGEAEALRRAGHERDASAQIEQVGDRPLFVRGRH